MENRIFSVNHGGNNFTVATTFRGCGEETLLLLHGLGCSKESFIDIWFRDELRDYSIISLDLLGFGDSSKSEKFSYKMEDHASVCAKILNEFSLKKIHIVAHSMGGAIGLHRLNSIEKIMISSSGHFMMNDNPDEFYPHLGRFLNST